MKVLPVLPNPKLSIFLLQDHLEIYTLSGTEPKNYFTSVVTNKGA